jgi:hypothetical protein
MQVRWYYIRHPRLFRILIYVCWYLIFSFLALIMLALIIFTILLGGARRAALPGILAVPGGQQEDSSSCQYGSGKCTGE